MLAEAQNEDIQGTLPEEHAIRPKSPSIKFVDLIGPLHGQKKVLLSFIPLATCNQHFFDLKSLCVASLLCSGSGTVDLEGVVPGGVTKGYEGRERAVLQEYQVILQKIVDR